MFLDELKQNNVKFGAICLQETWLADDGTIHFSIHLDIPVFFKVNVVAKEVVW